MATDEPKHTADGLLKAYARKRRADAGAPVELHPATRKLLQDEVGRTFAKPSREPKPGWLGGGWLRLAWGGAVLAVVVVAAVFILPPAHRAPEKFQLAQTAKDKVAGPLTRAKASAEQDRERAASGRAAEALADYAKAGQATPAIESKLPAAGNRIEQLSTRRGDDAATLGLAERQGVAAANRGLPAGRGGGLDRGTAVANNVAEAKRTANLDRVDRLAASNQQLANAPGIGPPAQSVVRDQIAAAGGPAPLQNPVVADNALNESRKSAGANDQPASPANRMTATLTANEREAAAAGTQVLYFLANPATATQSRRFVQLDSRARYRRNFNSPALPPVLTSFKIERAQDQVRIFDADESVYMGQISSVQTGNEARRLVVTTPVQPGNDRRRELTVAATSLATTAVPAGPATGEGMNYFFRAVGTNRSLQQLVVFDGEFVAALSSNAAVPVQGTIMQSLGGGSGLPVATAPSSAAAPVRLLVETTNLSTAAPPSAAQPVANQTFVGVIQGKVVVGGTNEFALEAVPAAR